MKTPRLAATRWVLVAWLCPYGMAAADPPEPPRTDIPGLIAQLSDHEFAVRTAATEDLIRAGRDAVQPVADAVLRARDVEVQIRGLDILGTLAMTDDASLEAAAYQAIEEIRGVDGTPVSRRAQRIQSAIKESRRRRAVDRLERLGARLEGSNIANGLIINNQFRNAVVPPVNWNDIQSQFPLDRLILDESWKGTTGDLTCLKELPEITTVVLDHPGLDRDVLSHIAGLPRLARLLLREIRITNEDLQLLDSASELESLAIWYIPVSEDALQNVQKLPRIKTISLLGTRVSDHWVQDAAQKYPGLRIENRPGAFLGVMQLPSSGETPIKGVVLLNVTVGGAAEQAGLEAGDILVRFDGQEVSDFNSLKSLISGKRPGEAVSVRLRRGSEEITREVVLGKWRSSEWSTTIQDPGALQINPVPVPAPAVPRQDR